MTTPICACGCGQPIPWKPHQRYIHGHHSRGKLREHSTRWKGGRRINNNGYWVVYLPDHPLAGTSGYVLEHRMIWATAHDQSIPSGHIIHHRDGNKTNNAVENLELKPFKLHQSMHAKIAAATPEHRERCSALAKRTSALWRDPEIRQCRLAGLSERAQKQFSDPQLRAKCLSAMREGRRKYWERKRAKQ